MLGGSPVNPATTAGPTIDAIGDVRAITNERTNPAGTGNALGSQVQTTVTCGSAAVSLGANVQGTSLLSWDIAGDLSADLGDLTNDQKEIDVLTVDQAGVIFGLTIDGVRVTKTASSPTGLNYASAEFWGRGFH